jgi:hypothetical protein
MTTATTATTSAHPSIVGGAVRDAAPVVLACVPFGLALGATLAATRMPALIAWSSSPLLFGGAAQLLAVQLLDAGACVVVVVLGALVVNARMLLYSAALARAPGAAVATASAASTSTSLTRAGPQSAPPSTTKTPRYSRASPSRPTRLSHVDRIAPVRAALRSIVPTTATLPI